MDNIKQQVPKEAKHKRDQVPCRVLTTKYYRTDKITKYMKRKGKRKVKSTVDEKREEVERVTWRNGRCQLVVIKECELGSSGV